MSLDLDLIRSYFPALQGEWTFMDNAGGSQTLKPVADRISDYLLNTNVQHGASYAVSQRGMRRVQVATEAMATLVNAPDPQSIVMGPSATALFRILSLCLSRLWQPGDEVIVTNTDHEANVSPWTDLQRHGIEVKTWRANPETLRLELEDLEALMSERTRLVAVTHTSNLLGTLNPIRRFADHVHQRGALIAVDGVAHAPHRLVDVQALNVDFYVFSFYKVYGPHYALMYGRKDLLIEMPGLNHYFIDGEQVPYKFQPGNVNFELAYGVAGIADYLSDVARAHFSGSHRTLREEMRLTFDLFTEHEERLSERLLDFLQTHPAVRIIGEKTADAQRRVPTVSFVVEGMDSKNIVDRIDPFRIGIRYGDFYAKKLIEDLGLVEQNGVVRVSLVHYNTLDEVDRLISAFEETGLLKGSPSTNSSR